MSNLKTKEQVFKNKIMSLCTYVQNKKELCLCVLMSKTKKNLSLCTCDENKEFPP